MTPTADITDTDIATTTVLTPSTSLTITAMTLASLNTLNLTVRQSEEFMSVVRLLMSTITVTSTSVTIHWSIIIVTGIKRHPTVLVRVPILADIMPQTLFLHTATTSASIVTIVKLTGSVTHVQVTIHKQRAKPFQTVILTSAITPVTITVLRCQSCVNVSQPTILYLPETLAQISAVFTPITPATISRHIVHCTTQAMVNVTPNILLL